ncbi:MAG: tRNA-guanine transglycosylase DpdA [Syntrophobacter sp.]
MKFIYADCLDYIDPGYNFIQDQNSEDRQKYWSDVFAHEYMDRPPYDGILVSRGIVGDHFSKGKYSDSEAMRFRREGARSFLRYFEEKYPGSIVLGDCGAFQYTRMPHPPYTPEDMMEFYSDGGFTHGCSIDHIIFHFDPALDEDGFFNSRVPDDARNRYEITLQLAEGFIKISRDLKGRFTPLGVVQGWSPLSMARAAQSLAGMGYNYLAIGGLVPLRAVDIHRVLSAIRDAIPAKLQIHLLGFAKADQLSEFFRYKVSSFDTSSPMIRAFKDGKRNYYFQEENGSIRYFKAIRIPQALENNTLKNKIRSGRYTQEDLLARESQALSSIREFAARHKALDETLEDVRAYSRFLTSSDEKSEAQNEASLDTLSDEYRQTLEARPWERCHCRICRECGVEAIIFRSSNRNKRRGMHNLEVFYSQLEHLRKLNGYV